MRSQQMMDPVALCKFKIIMASFMNKYIHCTAWFSSLSLDTGVEQEKILNANHANKSETSININIYLRKPQDE